GVGIIGIGVSSWSIQVSPVSTTTYHIASLVNGSNAVSVSGSETVTINHVSAGVISSVNAGSGGTPNTSDQVVCPLGTAAPLESLNGNSNNDGLADGTIGWIWQVSNDNFTWVNIPGTNSPGYTDPNPFPIIAGFTGDRFYRRFTVSVLNGVQC